MLLKMLIKSNVLYVFMSLYRDTVYTRDVKSWPMVNGNVPQQLVSLLPMALSHD